MTTPDRIEVRPTDTGYVWHFVARNGRTRANNEVFTSRRGAVTAVKNHLNNVGLMLGIALIYRTERHGGTTLIYPIIALS